MMLGCYTLDLYCKNPLCPTPRPRESSDGGYGPHARFIDEHGSICRRRARKRGWHLDMKLNEATCPACVKAAKSGEAPPHTSREQDQDET